jgi:hypothetical protein
MRVARLLRRPFTLALIVASLASARTAGAQTSGSGVSDSVFDNLSLFAGLDGSKQPQDLGINANMGVRFSANVGIPLVPDRGFGVQIGLGFNASDAAVHVLDQVEGTSSRTQTYITAGIFQRQSDRFNWGLVFDDLIERYYDNFQVSQLRGQVGVGVMGDNEVGAWFTKRLQGDDGVVAGTPVFVDPISQVNFFTRHTWASAAQTMVWVGVARGHHNVVFVFPDNSEDKNVVVYGAQLYFPLSEKFAVTGSANLVTPTATGTVDAYLGVAFYPGRGAMRASRNTFAPVLPVGNNPEMSINLHR